MTRLSRSTCPPVWAPPQVLWMGQSLCRRGLLDPEPQMKGDLIESTWWSGILLDGRYGLLEREEPPSSDRSLLSPFWLEFTVRQGLKAEIKADIIRNKKLSKERSRKRNKTTQR